MKNNLKPEISYVSDFGGNDIVQIFGENLNHDTKIYWWRPDTENTLPESNIDKLLPQTPPKTSQCFLPDNAVKQTLYIGDKEKINGNAAVIWAENDGAFSKPYIVNRPIIWNQSVKTAVSGGKVAFFGKNFDIKNLKNRCVLVNKQSGESTELISARQPSYPYDNHRFWAEFVLPENIPDGDYYAYLHTGFGGEIGWSEPVTLKVENSITLTEYYRTKWNRVANDNTPCPDSEIIIVESNPLGAFYDSYSDIQSAIDSLEATGGIVVLKAGIYAVSKTLSLKKGVVLIGAGENNTVIRSCEGKAFMGDTAGIVYAERALGTTRWAKDWQPHYEKYGVAPLLWIMEDAGAENIRFELGGGANIGIILGNKQEQNINGAFLNRITVDNGYLTVFNKNDEFGASSVGLLSVGSNKDLVVTNCNFKALSPICILPAHNDNIKIINNVFRCSPAHQLESYFGGVHNSMFVGNEFIGGRRSFMIQDGFSNNWVYENRSQDVSRSQNALEVYMSEHGIGEWYGHPVAAGEDYIEVAADPDGMIGEGTDFNTRLLEYDRFLCILDGRGFGQYRKVTRAEGKRIYVDKPWNVLPDQTTVLTLVTATVNNMWIDNNSAMSNGHSQFVYGCGIDNVISGHIIDLAAGIQLWAMYLVQKENQLAKYGVVAFNTVTNCQFRASGNSILFHSSNRYNPEDDKEGIFTRTKGVFGNLVKCSVMDGTIGAMYRKNQSQWLDEEHEAGVAMGGGYNVVAKNRILGYENSVKLIDNCEGNYFAKNIYTGEGRRFTGTGTPIGSDTEK